MAKKLFGRDSIVFDLNTQRVEPLAFTSPPALVPDSSGLRVGTTLGINASYTGATQLPVLELWTTATDDVHPSTGTKLDPWIYGTTALPDSQATRFAWGRVVITNGSETAEIWTDTPIGPIEARAVVRPDVTANDVRIADVIDTGDGIHYLPVIWINPTKVDASLWLGYNSTVGLKIQLLHSHLAADISAAIAAAELLTPADFDGLAAPRANQWNALYTGSNGYWIPNEYPAQTEANAGKTYEKSWALKRGRQRDESDPRRVLRPRFSWDGGASYSDVPNWYLQPNMPAIVVPDPATVIEVSNETQLREALVTAQASGVDTNIVGLGGNYGAVSNLTGFNYSTTKVKIVSKSKTSPMVFNVKDALMFSECSNITLEGIHFKYTVNAGSKGVRISECQNIKILNCNFEGYREGIVLVCSQDIEVAYNTMTGSTMDFMRICACDNVHIHHNSLTNHAVSGTTTEHRDFIQVFTNPGNSYKRWDGRYGCSNVLIENNIIINDTIKFVDGDATTAVQAVFFYNDMLRVNSNGTYPTYGSQNFDTAKHTNIVIRFNYIRTHFTNGIALAGIDGGQVYGNAVYRSTILGNEGNSSNPTINNYRFNNAGGVARNINIIEMDNVVAKAVATTTEFGTVSGDSVGAGSTISGNVVSATAWPPAWPYGTSLPTDAGQWKKGTSDPIDEPVDPDPNTRVYYPVERTPKAKTDKPAEYGFGFQFLRGQAVCETQPDYWIGGGDMNGPRMSVDGCKSIYTPAAQGLRANGFNSVHMDSQDPKRILMLGNALWWGNLSAKRNERAGIYLSTDMGVSFKLAQMITDTASSSEGYYQSLFCEDPRTKNLAANKRVVYLLQRIRKPGQAATGKRLWRSGDGGATWATVSSGSAATDSTFGAAHIMRMLPNGRLIVITDTGTWLSAADNFASWSRAWSDLPSSKTLGIAISADGKTIYVSVFENGLWKSTNGGTSFTRVYANSKAKRLGVDWRTSPETVYLSLRASGSDGTQMLVNANGGVGTWTTSKYTQAVGWPSGRQMDLSGNKNPGFDNFIVGGKDVCIVNAHGRMKVSRDGGKNFYIANGFTGLHYSSGSPSGAWQRTDDEKCVVFPIQDSGLGITTDGFASTVVRPVDDVAVSAWGWTLSVKSTYCCCWIPPSSGLPNGVLLAGIGDDSRQGVVRSVDLGVSYTATPVGEGPVRYIGHHPTKPEVVIAGRRISKDRGANWPTTIDGSAIGIGPDGALYVIRNGFTEIHRSIDWATAATPSFTPFYKASKNKFEKSHISGALGQVSQAENNVVWIEGPNGLPCRVKNTGSAFTTAVVDEFSMSNLDDVDYDLFYLADIGPDRNDPNTVYVTLYNAGGATVWQGKPKTAGALSPTNFQWKDWTGTSPKWQDNSVGSLRNGDLLVGGAMGVWLTPAELGYRSKWNVGDTFTKNMAKPVNMPKAA